MEDSGSLLGIFTAVRDMITGESQPHDPQSETLTREPGEQVVDAGRLTAAASMKGVRTDDESAADSHPRRGRGRAARGRKLD